MIGVNSCQKGSVFMGQSLIS